MNCAPARWGYVSIGDSYSNRNSRSDSFLPDQTTRGLAEQTNATLQDAVRRDGQAYVQHLDRFIIALQEELDSQGPARLPPAIDRATYRNDVKNDGTSIESRGWFRGPVANYLLDPVRVRRGSRDNRPISPPKTPPHILAEQKVAQLAFDKE